MREHRPRDALLARVGTRPEREHALRDRFGALAIAGVEQRLAVVRVSTRGSFGVVRERIGEP